MSEGNSSVLVIVATYNERDNIESLLSMLLALPLNLNIVVVDDNSPDGTGRVVDIIREREKRVHAIHRAGKMGLGTAHIAGIRFGLERRFDRIMTMDADFSHQPKYIPALVALSDVNDVVIGSRYVSGGGVRGCSLHRRALSHAANRFAGSMLDLRARDCTAGFRCYSQASLRRIDIDSIMANGYSFLIEILFRLVRAGATLIESPIVFEDRRFGTSKISRHEILKAIRTVLRLSRTRWTDQ